MNFLFHCDGPRFEVRIIDDNARRPAWSETEAIMLMKSCCNSGQYQQEQAHSQESSIPPPPPLSPVRVSPSCGRSYQRKKTRARSSRRQRHEESCAVTTAQDHRWDVRTKVSCLALNMVVESSSPSSPHLLTKQDANMLRDCRNSWFQGLTAAQTMLPTNGGIKLKNDESPKMPQRVASYQSLTNLALNLIDNSVES